MFRISLSHCFYLCLIMCVMLEVSSAWMNEEWNWYCLCMGYHISLTSDQCWSIHWTIVYLYFHLCMIITVMEEVSSEWIDWEGENASILFTFHLIRLEFHLWHNCITPLNKHPELSGCITTLIVRNTPWGQLSINLWQGLWPNRGASSQSQAVVQPWTTGADGNINVSTPKLSLDCIT